MTHRSRMFGYACTLLLFLSPHLFSQDLASESDLRGRLLYGLDRPMLSTSLTDSVQPSPVRKLLPANISVVENVLWGENGAFRSVGIAGELTRETRKKELDVRRTMLTAHQIGGFVTLGCMLGAVYCGQQLLDGNNSYRDAHETFVGATIFTYSGTAALSILSPPPMVRRDEVSTTTIHKALALIHVTGMILTPLLGESIKDAPGRARFHQASAYITTAAMAASLLVVTF